jgi:hypothetical protein
MAKDKDTGKLIPSPGAGHLPYYYENMSTDGTLKHAFYDKSADTPKSFIRLTMNANILFFLAYDTKNTKNKENKDKGQYPVAHCHLTNFNGYSAFLHFNVLRDYHKDAVRIGKETVDTLFKLIRQDKTKLVHTLYGITPKTNRAALSLVKELGFEKIDCIYKGCELKYNNRFTDGIVTKKTSGAIV